MNRTIKIMVVAILPFFVFQSVYADICRMAFAQYAPEWDFSESVNSYFDEFSYLCLNLENLGGLEDDNDQVDEKTKQDCKKQIESIDVLEKKELIQKYGELDE